MKNIIKTAVLMLALASLVSCKNESKKDETTIDSNAVTAELSFKDESVGKQFQHYIHLKTALVDSDMNKAKSGALMLLENTADDTLKELLTKISEASEIEEQRTLFSDVTEKMTGIVNESIRSGKVYQQFCPMAFNNEGGFWLSTEEEIRNPYFGDRMLKCGRVTETIK